MGDIVADATAKNRVFVIRNNVSPDSSMLKRAGAESQAIVVHNWGREVREKTEARK